MPATVCKKCPLPVGFGDVLCKRCAEAARVQAEFDRAASGDEHRAALERLFGGGLLGAEPRPNRARPKYRRKNRKRL